MDYGILIEKALLIAIEVLLPVALAYMVKWLNAKIVEGKAVVRKHDLEFAVVLIQRLVAAAEQNGLNGALKKAGAEKKAYVIEQAKSELEKHGININLDMLDALIEAEVNDAFGKIELNLNDLSGNPALN